MKLQIRLNDYVSFTKVPPETVTKKFLEISSEELKNSVKGETPRDTGKLRQSWTSKKSSNRVTLTNSRNYAVFVEKGTGIFGPRRHRIFPVSAQVLHWTSKGKSTTYTASNGTSYTVSSSNGVFARSVQGRPASHMAERGLEKFTHKVPKCFHNAMKQTLKK